MELLPLRHNPSSHFRAIPVDTGQTTVNKKAPIHYIISINDKFYRPLQKCFNPPPFHGKTVQSYILWLNLNKIIETSFYNQHINKVTPHFTFLRRAQNADTHARKQHRLSKNIFPVCSSFVLVIASDMHLEPESKKTFIFTQLKISRYNQHFFAIFRRILIN